MSDVVLREWVEEWIEFKRAFVKESTYANYLVLLNNQIVPQLGNLTMSEITTRQVQRAVTYWMNTGRLDGKGGLSQKTVRDIVAILRMCMYDYCKINNCNIATLNIDYPVNKKIYKRNVLSQEQQENLLMTIRGNLRYETLGYALSLYTGIRIGELCALLWEDIDLRKRAIIVTKTLQRIYTKKMGRNVGKTKVIITTPKSEKAIREIPISDALYTLLSRMCCKDKKAYLLTGTRKYIEPRLYRRHYEKFLSENKIEYVRFHGLRHTFATRCIEAGADYKVVSELLGHASVNLTLNLYVHPQWEDKKRCVELI